MYLIDPLTDPRWAAFADRHPRASAFHHAGWMQALATAYGYQPFAATSAAPGTDLQDAVPFCRVESWLTGRRIVSLPFADHCDPLLPPDSDLSRILDFVVSMAKREGLRFVELRPREAFPGLPDANRSVEYVAHSLDLSPPLETIFNDLHKDSIQRKIRRAEKEKLGYEQGRTPDLIEKFYKLLVRTRRRHQLPPQPVEWFHILARTMADAIQFRVASKDSAPVAAVVTLTHRNSMIYKYGCSDERFHATGAMPFLYWRMIEDAKAAGLPEVDFGRSDLDKPGLIRFKDQWGTCRADLYYYRFPKPSAKTESRGLAARTAKAVFARLPDGLLQIAGRALYRHIG